MVFYILLLLLELINADDYLSLIPSHTRWYNMGTATGHGVTIYLWLDLTWWECTAFLRSESRDEIICVVLRYARCLRTVFAIYNMDGRVSSLYSPVGNLLMLQIYTPSILAPPCGQLCNMVDV